MIVAHTEIETYLKYWDFFLQFIFVRNLIAWFLRVNFVVSSVILQCKRFGDHVKSFYFVRAISPGFRLFEGKQCRLALNAFFCSKALIWEYIYSIHCCYNSTDCAHLWLSDSLSPRGLVLLLRVKVTVSYSIKILRLLGFLLSALIVFKIPPGPYSGIFFWCGLTLY